MITRKERPMISRKVNDNWGREIAIYGDANGFFIGMHGCIQVVAGTTEQVSLWLTRTARPANY